MKLKVFITTFILSCQMLLAEAANIPLMPIKDIKPGMQGIGKTVVIGDTIEEFNVEVLGVTGKETSSQAILVRVYGDLIDKTGGVAHGMSGSPVYVDGRLIGAIAYGKQFDDPSYCLLQPIGNMLKMMDMPQNQQVDWIPKGTRLAAGGFSELGLECLKQDLKEHGLEVIAGVNGGEESNKPLEPGSSIGVSMMSGDLTLGAIGTVTWTDEQGNILAFGHPFTNKGESNFFLNRAWILGVIPNLSVGGYKMGNLGSPIGKISCDRSSGIAGVIGSFPKTLPLHITVRDISRGLSTTTEAKIVTDELLLPAIVNSSIVSCVSNTASRALTGTAKVKFQVTGAGKDKKTLELKHENMFYTQEGLEKILAQELIDSLKVLMNNKFEKLDMYGINVDVEITDAVQIAEVVKVTVDNKTVHPGDKVPLKVVMRPFRGNKFTQIVDFVVPKNGVGTKLVLNVHGGSSVSWIINALRKQKGEGAGEANKEQKQKTIADFVKEVNESDKNNALIVDITAGMKGLRRPSGNAGLAAMLKGSPYKKTISYDFIVDGEAEIVLNVLEK